MSQPNPPPVVSFEDDLLIVVDAEDRVIGQRTKAACHDGDGILHRAFSVFLFDQDHRLLLTQRSGEKRLWPGIWSNSCCSHPRSGESMTEAARRRTAEELGIEAPELEHLYTFTYHARYDQMSSEYEMCAVFIGRSAAEPKINTREIADWKWLSPEELDRQLQINHARHSPWLHLEWASLREHYWEKVLVL